MSIFIIIIQYCLAVIAHAIRQGKEKRAIKIGDKVKVYTIGDFSKEICGGPHVERTGNMGHFRIVKEEAVSAGVRRIKAVLE